MKHVLVPIDFSSVSKKAVLTALALAKKTEATIHILHIANIMGAILDREEDKTQEEVAYKLGLAENELKTFLASFSFPKDIAHSLKIIKAGEIEDLLLYYPNTDIDLIVLGSKGATGLKELFIGSNAERVIRNSEVPVLIIKNNEQIADFSRVLFASDFSSYSVSAFSKMLYFFNFLESQINVVFVNCPKQFLSTAGLNERIAKFRKELSLDVATIPFSIKIVNDYSVRDGITYAAKELNSTVLSIATEGRKGLDHLFSPSISEGLANHSKLTVVTFKM